MSNDGADQNIEASARPRWLRNFREKLTSHCAPGQVGWACALGAAIGVAPIPGLQLVAASILAWKLQLNLAIVLMVSNISLGPLLFMWAAISASIGRSLRTGIAPWSLYESFRHDFQGAGDGIRQFFTAVGHCFTDWLLGSALLMPVLALVFGAFGYLCAILIRASRRT